MTGAAWSYVQERELGHTKVYQERVDDTSLSVLVFVPFVTEADPPNRIQHALLRLPSELLSVDILIVRDAPTSWIQSEDPQRIASLISDRTRRKAYVGTLTSDRRLLSPLIVDSIGERLPEDSSRLQRIRELELKAQLSWSDAITEPPDAHFELPSGVHANMFVRVADAFSEYKVISNTIDWIQHLLREQTILVGDTWTILPLLQEMSLRVYQRFGTEAVIRTFSSYPSLIQLEQLFAALDPPVVGADQPVVIFVLSVASSKSLYNRIQEHAKRRLQARADVYIIVLVDTSSGGRIPEAFARVEGVIRYDVTSRTDCELCYSPAKSPLIVVDPKRYAPQVRAKTVREMLNMKYARAHSRFWEAASLHNAVGVHKDVRNPLSQQWQHLPVYIDVAALLKHPRFFQETVAALLGHQPFTDAVIIPEKETTLELRRLVQRAYGETRVVILNTESLSDREAARSQLAPTIGDAEHILILDDAVIDGQLIRAIHRLVQDFHTRTGSDVKRRTPEYQIRAFSVIARPPTRERWDRLQASLAQGKGDFLGTKEIILLDDSRCPWCAEREILKDEIVPTLADSRDWLQLQSRIQPGKVSREELLAAASARLDLLSQPTRNGPGLDRALYLCRVDGTANSNLQDNISPHSLFGESLKESVAYGAVSAAMQEIRDDRKRDPSVAYLWHVPKILTAYHDPLLSAAFLRASFSEEMLDYGPDPEFKAALDEISFASPATGYRQSPLIAAELLWATYLNKIRPSAASHVEGQMQPIIEAADPKLVNLLIALRLRRPQ